MFSERISESESARKADIASGKEVLLGTKKFRNEYEDPPPDIELQRTYNRLLPAGDLMIDPIRLFRGTEELYRKRLEEDDVVIK